MRLGFDCLDITTCKLRQLVFSGTFNRPAWAAIRTARVRADSLYHGHDVGREDEQKGDNAEKSKEVQGNEQWAGWASGEKGFDGVDCHDSWMTVLFSGKGKVIGRSPQPDRQI